MNTISRISVYTSLGLLPLLSLLANKPEKKPNVLFILADDFGYHDTSYSGSKFYETPNIDKIASQGMVFTNGYAACQVCRPSRASIMSGKFPARRGITDWIGAASAEKWRTAKRFNQLLPPEYVTLPGALKLTGYKTFFAGNYLRDEQGDLVNTLLAAAGFNLRKVPQRIKAGALEIFARLIWLMFGLGWTPKFAS